MEISLGQADRFGPASYNFGRWLLFTGSKLDVPQPLQFLGGSLIHQIRKLNVHKNKFAHIICTYFHTNQLNMFREIGYSIFFYSSLFYFIYYDSKDKSNGV